MSAYYPSLTWRKSSFSVGAHECVEVAKFGPFVLMRDSKNRAGSTLKFSAPDWRAFVQGVRMGEVVT
jgi:hypothetical protein